MKKRLPWIGTILLSLVLLYFQFIFRYTGMSGSRYFTFIGIFGVLYGCYRVIYPDKKDDKKE